MQTISFLVCEVIAAQRERELSSREHRLVMQAAAARLPQPGVRRSLAGVLVRLGLRLDPAAGEGLGALELSLAGANGGNAR